MAVRSLALGFLFAGGCAVYAAAPAIAATPADIHGARQAAPPAGAEYLSYTGTAMAGDATQFLYGERHVLEFRGGRLAARVVLYTCRDGSPFARKLVAYVDSLAPDFALTDTANGMREGIRTGAGGRTVYFQADGKTPMQTGRLPPVPGLVADAGFDEFVQTHWQDLTGRRTLRMRFLLPSRLADDGFQVRYLRSTRIDATPVDVFRLRLSGAWGWFLPGIDVSYAASGDHVLMRYDGLSDLADAQGNNFKAVISFPLRDRRPSDAAAMQAAQHAPLAPCK